MEDAGRAMAAARPRVVAALAGRLRDLDGAEDAFAEACAAAVVAWRREAPRDAAAWLWRTALRKALDARRRTAVRRKAMLDEPEPVLSPEDELLMAAEPIPDERLRLIFVCCHPALAADVRAALTLKVVCGLSTDRLARAFLVAEPAMLQRITRAKRKIRDAGIPYRVPPVELLPERVGGVLKVLYLVFNEGYAASSGDALIRRELGAEAIRLTRLVVSLLPDEPEALGLLALMLLHDARREARVGPDGELVLLEDQDRSRWDRARIAEGSALVERAPVDEQRGPVPVGREPGAYANRGLTATLVEGACLDAGN